MSAHKGMICWRCRKHRADIKGAACPKCRVEIHAECAANPRSLIGSCE